MDWSLVLLGGRRVNFPILVTETATRITKTSMDLYENLGARMRLAHEVSKTASHQCNEEVYFRRSLYQQVSLDWFWAEDSLVINIDLPTKEV